MRYHQHIDGDGEWVRLKSLNGFRIRCCSCRLVHVLDFKIVGKTIAFRAKIDKRATTRARKRMRDLAK